LLKETTGAFDWVRAQAWLIKQQNRKWS